MEDEIKVIDIQNYWLSLFPELKSYEELRELIQITNKNLDQLMNEAFAENQESSFKDLIFTSEPSMMLYNILSRFSETLPFCMFYRSAFNLYFNIYIEKYVETGMISDIRVFMENVIENAYHILSNIAGRVLILQINIARMQGFLVGETPEGRFAYFSDVLLNDSDYIKGIYSNYPLLVSIMCSKIENYFTYILKILSDAKRDITDLSALSDSGNTPGKIIKIVTGLGDEHNKGKTVSAVFFENGKIIYKPRSVKSEDGYKNVLHYFNNQNIAAWRRMKTLKTVGYDDHVWVEFIEHKDCESIKDIKEFLYKNRPASCHFIHTERRRHSPRKYYCQWRTPNPH